MFNFFKKKDFSFTDPFEPIIEVDTEKGVKSYLNSLSKISYEALCIEFSNVMAAKHNHKMSGIGNFAQNQKIVTDLTDKATLICISIFGYQTLMEFSNNDMRVVNQLVNACDNKVAAQPVEPEEHGRRLIEMLESHILH
jgi:hypothetical protein